MKAIIDGKRYDTDKAELIAEYDSPHFQGDFHSYEERLYRTARGNWFLAGKGGALTRYAEPAYGGGSCGGEGLFPLTADEARAWLEEKEETFLLERHFADEIEDA